MTNTRYSNDSKRKNYCRNAILIEICEKKEYCRFQEGNKI